MIVRVTETISSILQTYGKMEYFEARLRYHHADVQITSTSIFKFFRYFLENYATKMKAKMFFFSPTEDLDRAFSEDSTDRFAVQ